MLRSQMPLTATATEASWRRPSILSPRVKVIMTTICLRMSATVKTRRSRTFQCLAGALEVIKMLHLRA